MKKIKNAFAAVAASTVLSGCAFLHHVQIGQIDSRNDDAFVPFEILLNETGVSVEEIGGIAKALNTRRGDDAAGIAGLISLFQIGPKTGKPVYTERYAERMIYEIHQRCPTGRVTGLMSIRETRSYPAISGEIVKVTGYCLKPRSAPNAQPVDNEG